MNKILAIDDKLDNLISIKALIKNYLPNCDVTTSQSGKEGIYLAKTKKPDVILLDIIMPGMDGYAVCSELRNNAETMHIPIIMITAIKTDSNSRIKGLEAGADAFLSKPIDPHELTAQIKVALRIKHAEDELKQEKRDLESIVSERTAELRDSYEDLKQEVKSRKKTEEKLKESEKQYRQLFELLPYGGEVLDTKGKIIKCSPSSAKLFGYKLEELNGMHITKLFTPDSIQFFQEKFPILLSGKPMAADINMIRKDGSILNILRAAQPILNDKNEVEAILTLNINITERKQAEEALRESEKQLQTLIDNMPDFVCFKDEDGRWLLANESTNRIFQLEGIDYQGKKDSELAELIKKLRGSFLTCKESDARAWNEGSLIHAEETIPGADGADRIYDVTKVPVFHAGNERKGLIIIGHDITKRKQAENKLKESEKRFKDLVEMLPETVIETDMNLNITYVNKRGMEMSGYSKEDVQKGLNGFDLLTPESKSLAKKHFKMRLEGKDPGIIEYYAQKKDGTNYPILFHANPLINEGKIVGIRGLIIDITKRKQTEIELIESEEKLRLMINNSHIGFSATDLKGNFIEVNQAVCNMIGYTSDEILNKHYNQFSHPDDVEKNLELYIDLLENKITHFDLEKRYIHKNGNIVNVLIRSQIVRDDKGKPLFEMAITENITERKKAENALKESEARFKALHNASFGGIAIHDKGLILDCNKGLAKMNGYTVDELIGMDGLLLIAEESREMVMENILSGFEEPYEAIGIRKNGEKYPLRLEARMIPYKGKQVRVVEFRDITESKKIEEEIKQRMTELEIFNDAAVERELVINDLRKEINEMLEKLGKEKKYDVVT